MRIIIAMDVDFDGMDELSQQEQLKAVGEMVEAGADTFNMSVSVLSIFESPVGTLLDAPKPLYDLDKVCGGCKFFDTHSNKCSAHNKYVLSFDEKCDKWRYFA